MLNSDFGYPSLAPAKPTYEPDCHCHTDPQWRNSPVVRGASPDERIEELEYIADQGGDFLPDMPRYLFRSQLSWTLTPIGER